MRSWSSMVSALLVATALAGCGGSDIDSLPDPQAVSATSSPPAASDAGADGAADPGNDDDGGSAAATGAPINPIVHDCADPGVMRDGSSYYMTCTGVDSHGNVFPIYASSDFHTWTRAGQIFDPSDKPAFATGGGYWAPEIHHVPGRYAVYYAAVVGMGVTARHVVAVSFASSPTGPFAESTVLIDSPGGSAIDPHVFHDGNASYLYWKRYPTTNGSGAEAIFVQPLSADGAHLQGKATQILVTSEAWEGPVVEAPWVVKQGSTYYLFYSGNRYCNSTYAVGVARSASPTGPFVKHGAPILKSGAAWLGPGHNAITTGPDGAQWIVYHAYAAGEKTPSCVSGGAHRRAVVSRVTYQNGWPRISAAP